MPTVPGLVSHAVRVDQREHAALGAPPVLGEHRAPPLDHLVLGGRRDRRGAVQHGAQRRRVERGPLLVGQPQQAHAHRRHDVAVAHRPLLDQPQALRLVPPRHHDQLARRWPGRWPRSPSGAAWYSGPVTRCGPWPSRPSSIPAAPPAASVSLQARLPPPLHALGPAGGARGVEHRAAARARRAGTARRPGAPASASSSGPATTTRHVVVGRGRRGAGDGLVLGVGEEDRGAAVVEDVGDLAGGEVPVDRR